MICSANDTVWMFDHIRGVHKCNRRQSVIVVVHKVKIVAYGFFSFLVNILIRYRVVLLYTVMTNN